MISLFLIKVLLNALFLINAGCLYLAAKNDQRAILIAKVCATIHSINIAVQIGVQLDHPNMALFIGILGSLLNIRMIWVGIQCTSSSTSSSTPSSSSTL